MARLPRYSVPGQPQHIIQRGNNRQEIFITEADYQFFQNALIEAIETYGLQVHAYIWMTNHIHILATPEYDYSVSKVMQSVGRRYVQYFNHIYNRSGTLWEGRYRATVVDSERYFLTVMRYIELNAVRAGMVKDPMDYPWSSYGLNADSALGMNYGWLTPHAEYLRLGAGSPERRAAYRGLFERVISRDDLARIRNDTHKGWALGGSQFQSKIESLSQRQAASKGIGRPRKKEK